MLIERENSVLVIIDVQERLLPVMYHSRQVIDNCCALLRGADILKMPVIITEQYPKGLGQTMIDLREVQPAETTVISKTAMSALLEPAFKQAVEGKKQIIIAGIEKHICVLQTAVELKQAGHDVFVVEDACSSRTVLNEDLATRRFQAEGIISVSTEMVLFEWLRVSGTTEFKEIQNKIIR